jgi:ATP adenylyltransferase
MDYLWTPWRYTYVSRSETGGRKGVPPELDGWPADQDRHCVFCNLIAAADYAAAHGMEPDAADRAARIVHRGEHCFLCLNAYPYAAGHLLILPYAHLDSLAGLPAPAAVELMLLARRAEAVLREAYRPGGLNFGINLGESAGAGVAGHLHMHALPRWTGDANFMTVVAETRVLSETLDTTWERLKRLFVGQAT